jgi:methylisocitrate lyase
VVDEIVGALKTGPARFRDMLKRERIIVAPGVFNPISAQLAREAGFEALYFSGGAFANSLGLPDLGMTTLSELVQIVHYVVDRVELPLIVDVDTGFGEAVNVMRMVRELEHLDVAAFHMEDQAMPKRCGHLSGKQIVSVEEMTKKIVAAKEARRKDIVIIARTDARLVEGLDSAVDRARAYVRAGADMVFPEALESRKEFREFAKKVSVPLLANMTEFGRTPYMKAEEFERLGYKVVIFPMTAFRASLKAVRDVYDSLIRLGGQKGMLSELMAREDVYRLIDYHSYEGFDATSARKATKILKLH